MTEKDILNERFGELLLDSDAELDDSESVLDGVLTLDEDEESENEEEPDERIFDESGWSTIVENPEPFIMEATLETGDFDGYKPSDFFRLFLNDDLLAEISKETNRYGSCKHEIFTHTNPDELMTFIGLCLYMGNVRLPTLRHYWSTKRMYANMCPSIMPRDRFETLLGSLHFCNNEELDKSDRLFKIRSVLDNFNNVACTSIVPERNIAIDESIVPFRGRLAFKQYIPNKKHKFGVKLFKVCVKGGYTYKAEIYSGKLNDKTGTVSETVVMRLMDGLLDSGRRLFCDNWYSSMALTRKLLDRKTDFVGTFRKNRQGFPPGVTKKKLARGEMAAMQSKDGITVIQWYDKRPVFCTSTCHGAARDEKGVPELVKDYNTSMLFVDTSDQMAAYYPFIRRTSKWYLRVFFHLILHTSLVNAWVLYCKKIQKIPLLQFKEDVIEYLLDGDDRRVIKNSKRRILEKVISESGRVQKNCSGCYKKLSNSLGRDIAKNKVTRVNTRCSSCEKYVCLSCFNTRKCAC